MLSKKVAVIADDDKETLRILVDTLEADGFEVALAMDTQHALSLIRKVNPVLVVSEIGKANYDGLLLFETYKKDYPYLNNFKMVILTNNNEEKYEISSFESGIDDYLIKPLRKNAFKMRIVRYLNEENPVVHVVPEKQFQIRDLHFNLLNKTIYKLPEKKQIPIQSKTFEILFFLASNNDRIFSREALIKAVWAPSRKVSPRSIDVHILKIRQLLGENYVKTIKGVGYLFVK
ncbi:response regulator transcription factor [Marivirga sp. S37H4]|uniref:Response regulator transcription factor n=1 Tax=Marivirga aurantiaca TaxID=2802615 RepID=A0A934WX79_9BACT|nr:response regulator transcription factor [Marivirga aurantiaca]MBK6264485.1 response regulator transcription factor [Marivirga aurantiaca]